MQTQRTFLEDLKYQYQHGGMHIRLIFINLVIFLLINVVLVFGRLIGNTPGEAQVTIYLSEIFTLNTQLSSFITHPWGLFTSIFAHFSFWHLFWNMLFLYFVGRIFMQFFDGKRMLYTYLVGGIAGGLFELIAHQIFPGLSEQRAVVVGASGAVMAVFLSVAMYRPRMKVNLIFISIPIIAIAAFYVIGDLLRLGLNDGTAHFAHIGGAIIGMISVRNMHSSSNIINAVQSFGDRVVRLFSGGPKRKLKVKQGGNVRTMTDEEYNQNAKVRQQETDRILDKISKSGYESLTKREKDFLFNQSKNG